MVSATIGGETNPGGCEHVWGKVQKQDSRFTSGESWVDSGLVKAGECEWKDDPSSVKTLGCKRTGHISGTESCSLWLKPR